MIIFLIKSIKKEISHVNVNYLNMCSVIKVNIAFLQRKNI